MLIFTTSPDEDLWELLLIWTTFTIEEIIILYQQPRLKLPKTHHSYQKGEILKQI